MVVGRIGQIGDPARRPVTLESRGVIVHVQIHILHALETIVSEILVTIGYVSSRLVQVRYFIMCDLSNFNNRI